MLSQRGDCARCKSRYAVVWQLFCDSLGSLDRAARTGKEMKRWDLLRQCSRDDEGENMGTNADDDTE